jgi:hypothetical protein
VSLSDAASRQLYNVWRTTGKNDSAVTTCKWPHQNSSAGHRPCSRTKDFNPQSKPVPIYRPRRDERLSLPEQVWLKTIVLTLVFTYLDRNFDTDCMCHMMDHTTNCNSCIFHCRFYIQNQHSSCHEEQVKLVISISNRSAHSPKQTCKAQYCMLLTEWITHYWKIVPQNNIFFLWWSVTLKFLLKWI